MQNWDAERHVAAALHGRQKQSDQRADDGNHQQQFDERKDPPRRDWTYFSIPRCMNGQMTRKQINTEIFPHGEKSRERMSLNSPRPLASTFLTECSGSPAWQCRSLQISLGRRGLARD